MKKIIVMQFLEEGCKNCLKVLAESGISPDEVQIFSDIYGVEEAIGTNDLQLLLASSFHGIQYQFPNFIQLLRDKNPQLVCVGYCYELLTGPFEITIFRGLEYKNMGLKKVIHNFQNGFLKRRNIEFESRHFSYAHHRALVDPVLH